MKKFTKRSLAWLSSLMLLISLLASLIVVPAQAASVDYVYSGNYVYNWGERDELATFLSPMAEDFYADNGVTYAQLASLSGSSVTNSVPYSSLYDELHQLMYNNLDNPTSYDATRSLFKYTDCENSGGSISSFYSAKAIGPSWDSGATWNREHVWPNSKSNGGSSSNTQRETDIMMLRPASVSENSSRGNTAYGEGSKFYDPNELGQNVRGDAARIVLYVYVCWGGSSSHDGALDYMWGSSGVMESRDVLLKWIEEDPVDTWELGRNDAVEAITGTRNVFVDYPELAFQLFGETVPADYDSPSGAGSSAGYTVTASTNNSSYGTVSVKGNVITATPKTGYAATGYTILSGSATVTRNGNVFTVSPSSDVSVRINFGKREEVSVRFTQSGGVSFTQTAYAGDAITLPAHSGAVPDGQTFLGWCTDEVSETTDEPTYYAVGSTLTASAGMTLYALYARSEEGGVVNNNTFEPYSGALTEGDYLILYNGGALIAEVSTAARFNYVEATTTAGSIKDPAANAVWHIAKDGNNWTLYNADAKAYAGGNGTKNKGALLTTLTDYGKWTVTGTSAYEFVNVGNKAAGVNANLRRNGTYGFACYSTSTGGALTLYKRASGTVYYFTATQVVCDTHTYDNACDATCNVCGATRVPASHVYGSKVTTAATCGAAGVRTYTCSVCGDSYTEAIPATGEHTYDNVCDAACNGCGYVREITHTYGSEVTVAPTCGEDGVRTYTCDLCGDSYTEAIPATGEHTYDNACDADCNVCGGTRTPSSHVYTADCDTVCDVCGEERTVSAGGETTITFDADKTDRVEFSTATQVWQNGALVITNNKTSGSSNIADYSNPVRFYKGSEIIIAHPGMTSLVISAPTGTYGTPWGTTLDNAGLTYTVDGGVYTVTFAQPTDSITLTASAQVRANSITAVGQGAGAEHEYDDEYDADCNECGAIREVACRHEYTYPCDAHCALCGELTNEYAAHTVAYVAAKAPTCVEDGNIEYWYCTDCGKVWLSVDGTQPANLKTVKLPATGEHTYDDEYDADCNECGGIREVACRHEYTYPCDAHCALCGELTNEYAAHTVAYVAAKAPTCVEDGNIEYWYCTDCGKVWLSVDGTQPANLKTVKLPATGEHTYDDEYDADCNECGGIREVPEKPVDVVYGDANGDGSVNARDAAVLQQFVAGWDVTLNEASADANGDGSVNARDAAILQQYVAGWDVELG